MRATVGGVVVLLAWLLLHSSQGTDASASRPPIIIIPGYFTSQLIANYTGPDVTAASSTPTAGTQTQAAVQDTQTSVSQSINDPLAGLVSSNAGSLCPSSLRQVPVWPPDTELATSAVDCWHHLITLQKKSTRFQNNTNTEIWTSSPHTASSAAGQSIYTLAGYDVLLQHIEQTYGYKRGQNLFILPHDIRLDLSTLESSKQLQQMTAFINKQVARSGSQGAILIGHSSGALYGLKMLQDHALRQKVKGFISLGGPFGGTSAVIPARLSGSFDYLLPWLLQEMQKILNSVSGSQLETTVRQYMYQISSGMPSVGMLMPYHEAFGSKMALVTAGSGANKKTYSVDQISQMLADVGDEALAAAFKQTHTVNELLEPLTAVNTFCIYGNSIDTPLSWRYLEPFKSGAVNDLPQVDVVGKGDGVVNLESLRLCEKLVGDDPDRITELRGVTHFTVHQKRSALRAIQRALDTLLDGV